MTTCWTCEAYKHSGCVHPNSKVPFDEEPERCALYEMHITKKSEKLEPNQLATI